MAISLRDLMDEGIDSMRDQASANNHLGVKPTQWSGLEEFTMRELITPQHQVTAAPSPKHWTNWVGDHEWPSKDRTEYRPTTRDELVAALVNKVQSDKKIRAVGSGHSHSNAPAPPKHFIELNPGEPGDGGSEGLNDVLNHNGWLKDEVNEEYLRRVESGILLRRLNRHVLHQDGYALKNMGSFDGQTVAGAVNTSTHGTGIKFKSFADSVKSVEIATVPESESGDPIVRLFRIERSNGITDREAFEEDTAEHEMELIQDDDLFHSVVVGYGCMGIVYAYTLEVIDNYWLKEETKLMAWSDLKSELGYTKSSVKQFLTKGNTRHCQILLNLAAEQVPKGEFLNKKKQLNANHGSGQHQAKHDPLCMVRRHKPASTEEKPELWEVGSHDSRWPPERTKATGGDVATAVFNQFHPLKPNEGKAWQLHRFFFHPQYKNDPFVKNRNKTAWYVALRRLRDRGKKSSSEYRHPEPPQPTPTTELGVPLGDLVDAVDAVRRRVRNIKQGDQLEGKGKNATGEGRDVFVGVPMGIRFTAPSEHFLSPEFDRETAMIEVPLPVNNENKETNAFWRGKVPALTQDEMREYVVEPALTKIHDHLRSTFPARPHMGKHNTLSEQDLDKMYEYFDASDNSDVDVGWLQAYNRFNAFGTFNNAFTSQLGIDN